MKYRIYFDFSIEAEDINEAEQEAARVLQDSNLEAIVSNIYTTVRGTSE